MDQIVQGLQGYGLPGLVILALLYAVMALDSRRNGEITARLADAKEWVKTVENSTAVMEKLSDEIRDLRQDNVKVIEALAAAQRATGEQIGILNANLQHPPSRSRDR